MPQPPRIETGDTLHTARTGNQVPLSTPIPAAELAQVPYLAQAPQPQPQPETRKE